MNMHFNVAVLTEEGQTIMDLLEPYSENKEVEPYVVKLKDDYLKEIEEYCKENEQYRKEIHGLSDLEKIEDWTGYHHFDDEGNPLTTINPIATWDYYEIGGRWEEMLLTKEGKKVNSCMIEELMDLDSLKTCAVVTPDGEWHESNGYYDEQWSYSYKEKFLSSSASKLRITIVDCHI